MEIRSESSLKNKQTQMTPGLPKTAALSAGNGAVIDIPSSALEGQTSLCERQFSSLMETGERSAEVRIEIGEIINGDKVVLNISDGQTEEKAEVDSENLKPGGNAINTATAAARVEELMTGETGVYVHGPLNNLHEGLIRDQTGLTVNNSLTTEERRQAMPSRFSIVDPKREKYLLSIPKFKEATHANGELRFLIEQGILVPMTNGDLILSSCINSRFFWNRIKDYLEANPKTTLYFQPGSVHLGRLVANKPYLPKRLLASGRIVVILNVDEIKGFADNLASQGLPELRGETETTIMPGKQISSPLANEKEAMALNIAKELAKRGLNRVVITNGPGSVISYEHEGHSSKVYITSPENRKNVETMLAQMGIETPSREVLATGCGDTFTGALIALSRLYPNADKNTLMEVASIFSAIQTHNPESNIGNLNLEPVRALILERLGQPEIARRAA